MGRRILSIVMMSAAILWVMPAVAGAATSATTVAPCNTDKVATYICDVHQAFLGRQASPADLRYWRPRIGTTNRIAFTSLLARSHEAHRFTVFIYFHNVLGRLVDPGGSAYWTSRLGRGMTAEAMEATLLGSAEYFNLDHGAVHATNANFVGGLYSQVLGRSPAAGEVGFWAARLQAGEPRSTVAGTIIRSHEVTRHRAIAGACVEVGHALTPTATATWAGQLALHSGTWNTYRAFLRATASSHSNPRFSSAPYPSAGSAYEC